MKRIKCQSCGKEINYIGYGAFLQSDYRVYAEHGAKFDKSVFELYKGYSRFARCFECGEPIAYTELPMDEFFK